MSNIHTVHSQPSRAPPQQGGDAFGMPQQQQPTNYYRLFPLVTILVTLTCFQLWLINFAGSGPVPANYSNCPSNALNIKTLYRYFTAGFLHLGFLHMFFNMLIVIMLGISLERVLGSLPLLGSIFSSIFLIHLLYNGMYYITSLMTDDSSYMHTCVVGYSGVIFAHLWMKIVSSGVSHINCCSIRFPARAYPFLLLIIMSLFGGSFAAHFCGLLFGIAYTYGFVNFMSVPRTWLVNFEKNTKIGQFLCNIPLYCETPMELNHVIAEDNLTFTRRKYEDVEDKLYVKILTWICCLPCVQLCKPRGSSHTNNTGRHGPIGGSGQVGSSASSTSTGHTWQGTGHSLAEPDQPHMSMNNSNNNNHNTNHTTAPPSRGIVDRLFHSRSPPAQNSNNVDDIDLEDLEQGARRNTNNNGRYAQLQEEDEPTPRHIQTDTPIPPTPQAHQEINIPSENTPATTPYNPNERADPRRTRPGRPVSRLLQ